MATENDKRSTDTQDSESRAAGQPGSAALDPSLQDQFDRRAMVAHKEPQGLPRADALQWPHYEAEKSRADRSSEDDRPSRGATTGGG
jgi:hypothetical protein